MDQGSKKAVTPVIDPQVGSDAALLQASLSVFQHLEYAELAQTLLDRCFDWIGARAGVCLSAGEDGRRLAPVASTFAEADPRYRAFTMLEASVAQAAFADGLAVFDGWGPLVSQMGRWPDPPPPSCVALPILDPTGRWSALILLLVDERPEARRLARIARLVELVRPAVGHALQLRSMRELVIMDDTAHCYNRRYLEEFLPEELSRASRFRAPLSLIFLDMDNLKQVNNAHGHAMGSRTLIEVSARIRVKIRKFDKLFRFGGDEFCIVLPETEWHGAMEVAERVRDAIARKPFLVPELGAGNAVTMTASLGIAAYPLHARSQQDLVERADRAMQRIKRTSKDGIGVAEIAGGDDERRTA